MSTEEQAASEESASRRRDRARERASAVHQRYYEGTWIQEFAKRCGAVDMVTATTLFGSGLLLSALPLIIVLSSIADERVDDDVSRHIGLNHEGSEIVRTLFRARPAHQTGPIILAIVLCLAGTLAAVGYLAEIYERIFELEHRGWRDWWRFVVWTGAAILVLVIEGAGGKALGDWAGVPVRLFVTFWCVGGFFHWTMWFLLARRKTWRSLFRPALCTAVAWMAFAIASSFLFSSTLVSDSKLYGTIGVVFTLLTWFVAVGVVIVLGGVGGVVWEGRRGRGDSVGA